MKIAVLTSGGVDSSVALRLLKDEGHDVTAFYLKIWLEDELSYLGECPWEEDLGYVRQISEEIKVPLQVVPMQKEYWDRVVRYTIAEAKAGRTPNPDIFCNQLVKFGAFFDTIDDSFEKVATGHYAQKFPISNFQFPNNTKIKKSKIENRNSKQIQNTSDLSSSGLTRRGSTLSNCLTLDSRLRGNDMAGFYLLKTSPDPVKDQTYFLAHLDQKQLARAMFPIGKYTKEEVRQLAEKFNLPNKNRKDSQGICFLGKIPFREFLRHHLQEMPGDFVNVETSERVGRHLGYWFYTIGQRNGLGLSGGPWFVAKKDIARNIVYLVHGYKPEGVLSDKFEVEEVHWIIPSVIPAKAGIHVKQVDPRLRRDDILGGIRVKIRHGAASHSCALVIDGDCGQVTLAEKVHGVAPGQFAVFYSDDICLGCGRIV